MPPPKGLYESERLKNKKNLKSTGCEGNRMARGAEGFYLDQLPQLDVGGAWQRRGRSPSLLRARSHSPCSSFFIPLKTPILTLWPMACGGGGLQPSDAASPNGVSL